jgi:DNA adenine methylase
MNSCLKWHGGKHYLAPLLWKLAKQIPHTHRVETHGGSAAFTLACDPEGYSEVINDKYFSLINFWRCLQDPHAFGLMQRYVECTPVSSQAWDDAGRARCIPADSVEPYAAAEFFIRCRQSMAGRMKSFGPLTKRRTRRGMNEQASAWLGAIEGLPEVHARLKRVVLLCDDALAVLHREDTYQTLFYLDPPYMPEARTAKRVYAHEMTFDEHVALLNALGNIDGKFLLSGYRSHLYDVYCGAQGWKRIDVTLANHAASGDEKREMTECIWTNAELTNVD